MLTLVSGPAIAQITYERIRDAANEPESWLTYSGSYYSQRFSTLDQINKDNVARLRPAWVYEANPGTNENTPIVADGVMYIAEPVSTVSALDALTGNRIWTWSPTIREDVLAPTPFRTNRGVAVLDGRVFIGTLDGFLVALDATNGEELWNVMVDDNGDGYSLTSAPLALDGMVVTGVAGGERGIRGFVDAYDAVTGERLWRTWTVPAPGEPGSETWEEGSDWEHGGASTWLTGSYDPELNLLYWPTGNPGPDYNGEVRPGDNLFSNSLLALDPATGEMQWYFQFTPHDTHDWDSTEIPVLFDVEINGRERKLVAMANRNGFYYVLDREDGAFVTGIPFARQTWAEELDVNGRPIVIPGTDSSPEGTLVYPSMAGAANWHSPSYSPNTGLFYQNARDAGGIFTATPDVEFVDREIFTGGRQQGGGDDPVAAVRALEATTGRLMWEFEIEAAPLAGILSTSGGLVFAPDGRQNFYALDDETGEVLWDFKMRGNMQSNPVTFSIDGRQYVMMPAGNVLYAFALPQTN